MTKVMTFKCHHNSRTDCMPERLMMPQLFRECSSIFALPPIFNAGFVLKPSKAQIQLILPDDIKDIFSDFRKLHQEDIDQLLS